MPGAEFRPLRSDAERDELKRSATLAFGTTKDLAWDWYLGELMGDDDTRGLFEGGEMVASVCYYRFGHWFGGRRVPALGVALVSVPPEGRGAGAGSRLMAEVVREARREGFLISTLYASNAPVYRRAGYEVAGEYLEHECPTRELRAVGEAGAARVRRAGPDDRPTIRGLYERAAPTQNGMIDRNEQMWLRIFEREGTPAEAVVVEEPGADGRPRAVGAVVYRVEGLGGSPEARVSVVDLVFEQATAAAAIIRFLTGFGSVQLETSVHGPRLRTLPVALREPSIIRTVTEHWMLRVVDVEGALSARGYTAGVSAAVTLEVRDGLLPECDGVFTLRVADGEGSVERGVRSAPALSLDVGALAPLYTGYLTPHELASAGLIDGPGEALRAAGAIFAGPAPVMSDRF
jgi:predicted acetyltransferase